MSHHHVLQWLPSGSSRLSMVWPTGHKLATWGRYRQTSNITCTKFQNLTVSHLFLQLSCPIHWSHVLSQEWRCSWSSADSQCSNYIRKMNNFIANYDAPYIRGLTVMVCALWGYSIGGFGCHSATIFSIKYPWLLFRLIHGLSMATWVGLSIPLLWRLHNASADQSKETCQIW